MKLIIFFAIITTFMSLGILLNNHKKKSISTSDFWWTMFQTLITWVICATLWTIYLTK